MDGNSISLQDSTSMQSLKEGINDFGNFLVHQLRKTWQRQHFAAALFRVRQSSVRQRSEDQAFCK